MIKIGSVITPVYFGSIKIAIKIGNTTLQEAA